MKDVLIRFCFLAALLTVELVLPQKNDGADAMESHASGSAVVLMYHRFGEGGFAATNTTVMQLEDHIAALQQGGHVVVPLADVVSALKGETVLPEKAVAITVDDAYRSFLTVAWPRFKAAGYPVTLFVATGGVDAGYDSLLSWKDIRFLQKGGVTIGAHSNGHGHFPALSSDAVEQDILDMSAAFQRELGFIPPLFAYPYGDAGLPDMAAVRTAEFTAAFGQQSGAMGTMNNLFYLPRFALNENYGRPDRFRLVINTRPLPVAAV